MVSAGAEAESHHSTDPDLAWLLNLNAKAVNLTVGANLRLDGYRPSPRRKQAFLVKFARLMAGDAT